MWEKKFNRPASLVRDLPSSPKSFFSRLAMRQKAFNLSFLLLASFGLQLLFWEIRGKYLPKDKPNVFESANGEHFDPSLSRLTTISSFTAYCDSINGSSTINPSDSEKYAGIVASVLRERFYHGYSYYRLGQNSLAFILAPLLNSELRAIVIPDDILKHPNAACSQQSIVGMEAFRRRGFKVRKVGFKTENRGHFCYETFFNGKWHFFDPDGEPRLSVMKANHFPAVSDLVQSDSLLHTVYNKPGKGDLEKIFPSYSYGPVDKFPARNARAYQYVTKYLSYTLWLWIGLAYLLIRRRFIRVKTQQQCVELQDSLASGMTA